MFRFFRGGGYVLSRSCLGKGKFNLQGPIWGSDGVCPVQGARRGDRVHPFQGREVMGGEGATLSGPSLLPWSGLTWYGWGPWLVLPRNVNGRLACSECVASCAKLCFGSPGGASPYSLWLWQREVCTLAILWTKKDEATELDGQRVALCMRPRMSRWMMYPGFNAVYLMKWWRLWRHHLYDAMTM